MKQIISLFFLVLCVYTAQAQTAFEKLPDTKTLSPGYLEQIKQSGRGIGIKDAPAAIFLAGGKDEDVTKWKKFKQLSQEVINFTGLDELSADFSMFTLVKPVAVSVTNKGKEYLLDSVSSPKFGLVLTNGKDEPIIIRGLKDSYLPDFKLFFGTNTTQEFQKMIDNFYKKADRKSNRLFKKDFRNVLDSINALSIDIVSFPKTAIAGINEDILNTIVNDEDLYPNLKNGQNIKQVYAEYTEGSWKGRNYTFDYDKKHRLVQFKSSIYDNTDITTYKIKYGPDGLIKDIKFVNERQNINATSYEMMLIKTTGPFTICMMQVQSKDNGAIVSDNLESIYWHQFFYDNLYQLKEKNWLLNNKLLNNTTYYYDDRKNLKKKIWDVFNNEGQLHLSATYQYTYDNKNKMNGHSYVMKQKDTTYSGRYIISPEGEWEVDKYEKAKTKLTIFTYDAKGNLVLRTSFNKNFPHKLKFSYTYF